MPHEICPSCDQPIDDNTPHPFCARPCGCGIAIPHSTSAHTRPTQPSVDSDAQLPIPDLQPTDALPTDQLNALGVPPVDLDGQQNYNTAHASIAKPREPQPTYGLRGTQTPHGIDVFSISIVDNPDPPDCRIQPSQPTHRCGLDAETGQPRCSTMMGSSMRSCVWPDKQLPTEPSSSYPAMPFGQTQHSSKRGILLVDDPPSGTPEPLTAEQRQKVEDWYKQAPIPGLPTLDDVERQMSPMRATDLLVIKNDPKPGMGERIKQLTAQIKADYAPRPIMFDADDGDVTIEQVQITPDPVEQCVGTYVDIYRMTHPCTGVHGCRSPGCPALRKPEQLYHSEHGHPVEDGHPMGVGRFEVNEPLRPKVSVQLPAMVPCDCPKPMDLSQSRTAQLLSVGDDGDGFLTATMAAIVMDAKEASARAMDAMVVAAPSCRNCGSKRVEPDGGRKLCLNCGFRQ